MHPQQHLYGLTRHMGHSILHGNGLARLRASPRWHRNGLARTDSVLGYDSRGWLIGEAMLVRDRRQGGYRGQRGRTSRQPDRQAPNIMLCCV